MFIPDTQLLRAALGYAADILQAVVAMLKVRTSNDQPAMLGIAATACGWDLKQKINTSF